MEEEEPSAEICDLFLTSSGARAEHYEIAAYSGLITSAKALGESEVAKLLEENLRQEKAALGQLESIGERLAKSAKKSAARSTPNVRCRGRTAAAPDECPPS